MVLSDEYLWAPDMKPVIGVSAKSDPMARVMGQVGRNICSFWYECPAGAEDLQPNRRGYSAYNPPG